MHCEAAYVLTAALAERLRTGRGWHDLSDERLSAGHFELTISGIAHDAGLPELGKALQAELRRRGVWPTVVRQLMEPQLQANRQYLQGLSPSTADASDAVLWADLAAEWLLRFDSLPREVEVELVQLLLQSARDANLRAALSLRRELEALERRQLWNAVGSWWTSPIRSCDLQIAQSTATCYGTCKVSLAAVAAIQAPCRSRLRSGMLLHTFCPLLPRTAFPERSWIGDRNGWTATDFLTRLINRLGADTSDDAAAALQRLLQAAPDGYTEHLQSVAMENAQLRVEADYLPPTVAGLAAIADDATPLSMGDLQAFMLEDIAIAQGKVISGDVDSWREFFDDAGEPDRFDSSLLVERGAARATSSAAPFGRAI